MGRASEWQNSAGRDERRGWERDGANKEREEICRVSSYTKDRVDQALPSLGERIATGTESTLVDTRHLCFGRSMV